MEERWKATWSGWGLNWGLRVRESQGGERREDLLLIREHSLGEGGEAASRQAALGDPGAGRPVRGRQARRPGSGFGPGLVGSWELWMDSV